MIVPMKKASILVQTKDAGALIDDLCVLGLLHVEHKELPKAEAIDFLKAEIALLNEAEAILTLGNGLKDLQVKESRVCDCKVLARHIVDLKKRLTHLEDYSLVLKNSIIQWQEWGDFKPEDINHLEKKNIYLRLYHIPKKEISKIPNSVTVNVLAVKSGIANCLVASFGKVDIGYKEIGLPNMSLKAMKNRLNEDIKIAGQIKEELESLSYMLAPILSEKKSLIKALELQEALKGMAITGDITYISGYAPDEAIPVLEAKAKQNKWGLIVKDTTEEEDVPVLIRNPKWISIINPLFKFLEILPGYRELDVSLPFLIFFSIFFGMLIGDAGYGMSYLLITYLIQKKVRKNNKRAGSFTLFYILSSCAIVWGVLTGTFFGQEWVLKAGYKPLLPALNDEKNLQRFCFFLGAFHLSIAHIWRAIIKMPSLSALSDFGWMGILWGAFFIARVLILGDTFPVFGKWLIISGVTCVVLFTSPQKNIFKAIGCGLGALALSLMNNFTDVVSYIRLFAVGMAGIAIADAFNAMAGMVGNANILSLVVASFIVIIGQALGIVLGPVSVLVHGVRLNVLEFSGHANVSWSGKRYNPLKKL